MPTAPALVVPAPTSSADDPELDGTDGAHPAWWRGNDRGVEAACDRIAEVLDGAPGPYHFGSAKLTDVATRLRALASSSSAIRDAAEQAVAEFRKSATSAEVWDAMLALRAALSSSGASPTDTNGQQEQNQG